MILFVNGPLGVGKTSVAKALVEKMPHATLYDPEIMGAILKKMLGAFAWRASHVDACLEAMHDPRFGTELRTDSLAPAEVADRILQSPTMSTG